LSLVVLAERAGLIVRGARWVVFGQIELTHLAILVLGVVGVLYQLQSAVGGKKEAP